jgi:dienelactone hydrolase
VIGFCFGGPCALDLARINVGIKIAVNFHGTLTPLPDQPEPEKEFLIEASILMSW